MKIWFDDIVYSLQKAGGISVVWSHTTRDVPYEASHIRYEGTEGNSFAKKVDNHYYEMKSNRFLSIKRYINPRLSREADLFLFHSSYYRYCPNKKAINITTVHDFTYELYDHRFVGKIHKWQKKRAVMHSDGVICISENTRADLQKYYPEYKGLIKIVNNGYDNKRYYYENKNKDKIILSVGGRRGYKRFDLTVQIVKAQIDTRLVIVGGGQLTAEEKVLLEKEIPGRYEKVGYLTNDELRDLYNRAFFLSYPSDYEGFGIPAIEAQACGCPVICQAKSSLPEVVKNTAIYIDPENMEETIAKIKKLYDEEFYRDIVKKGLENSKRFSWDKCREETIAFYQDVLKRKGLQ